MAAEASPRSRRALLWRLPFELPAAFVRFYLLRRHITGGWRGFMFALTAAFARTLRIAKMLDRAEDIPAPAGILKKHEGTRDDPVDRPGPGL